MTSAAGETVSTAATDPSRPSRGRRVLVGMSGGLDSTATAMILRDEGCVVEGAAVIMHEHTDTAAARCAAAELGIPLHEIDARARFCTDVMRPFAEEYMRGRTPNPCVFCNPAVKFGVLCDYARAHGFDYVATGHYAFVGFDSGRFFIRRAVSDRKDQSYALWGLSQDQLSMLILPLGGREKAELRELARSRGLSAASSAESEDICFIPDGDYVSWLKENYGYEPREGDFVDEHGNVLGRHRGIAYYTVGQRKGLGLSIGAPMYVKSIDAENNTVTLTPPGGEYMSRAVLSGLNFQLLDPAKLPERLRAEVRIRYAAKPVPAEIYFTEAGSGLEAEVVFDTPARAVTPGQSAVAYSDDALLFGGFIKSAG